MEETFQISEKGMSILEILNTMISPSDEASGANTVRDNEMACEKNKKRRKRSTNERATSKFIFNINLHGDLPNQLFYCQNPNSTKTQLN